MPGGFGGGHLRLETSFDHTSRGAGREGRSDERGRFVMGTSKPPPGRGSGPITGSDWSLGINARSANPMTDAALLAEIGRKLRRYYQALTEEALPEHFLEIVDRFPTGPNKTRGDGR